MYKIKKIQINGLWGKHSVNATFKDDVNVVIGKNGTGKTTFMNILHGVLSVDIDALVENQFDSFSAILVNEMGKKRSIKARKIDSPRQPFPVLEYRISTRSYRVLLVPAEDRRSQYIRKKAGEEAIHVRESLEELISLASLSVYRIRADAAEADARDRTLSRRFLSPVDFRLSELTQQLTHYQLELAQRAQDISIELQKNVLASLLYDKQKDELPIQLNFDAQNEKQALVQAYAQLGVTGPAISKRISDHVAGIESVFRTVKSGVPITNFSPLEAKRRTDHIVQLSLNASRRTQEVYSQINLFLTMIGTFITDKNFRMTSGDLVASTATDDIALEKLSSGEKQLLILMIEAVLQRQRPFVFLADEPELSLHIAWQRKIIPAVKKINPNAQIIVATHSPEVAGRYTDSLIDMEDMINGKS